MEVARHGPSKTYPAGWDTDITPELVIDPFLKTSTHYPNDELISTCNIGGSRGYFRDVLFNHQNPNNTFSQTQGTQPTEPFQVAWPHLVFGERIDKGSYFS